MHNWFNVVFSTVAMQNCAKKLYGEWDKRMRKRLVKLQEKDGCWESEAFR
jgi:hypothetical protein